MTLLAFGIGVYEEFLDPFGLSSFTDKLSANTLNNLMAPFYGKSNPVSLLVGKPPDKKAQKSYPSKYGQSQIIVIMIDDEYIKTTQSGWPLPPQRYQRLLRNINKGKPAAIFLDIFFDSKNDRRAEAIGKLFYASKNIQESSPADEKTTIVFAGTLNTPVPQVTLNKDTPNKITVSAPESALAQMKVESGSYTFSDGQHPTAAWRLYKLWCGRKPERCQQSTIYPRQDGAEALQDLHIQWGYAPNKMMTELSEFGAENCQQQAQWPTSKLAQSIAILFRDAIRGVPKENTPSLCPYTSQINIQVINHLSESELIGLLKDKIVLIGTSLKLYPDLHFSPTHGHIPGVFWHAMALDNLIEYGDGYKLQPEGFQSSYTFAFLLALILGCQGLLSWLLHNPHMDDGEVLKLQAFNSLFLLCVIAAVVTYSSGINNWGAANWIGIALLALLIESGPLTLFPKLAWSWRPFSRTFEPQLRILSCKTKKRFILLRSISMLSFLGLLALFFLFALIIFLLPHIIIAVFPEYQAAISITAFCLYIALCLFSITFVITAYTNKSKSQ